MPDAIAALVDVGLEVAKTAPVVAQMIAGQTRPEAMPETEQQYYSINEDFKASLAPGERFVSAAERKRLREIAEANIKQNA